VRQVVGLGVVLEDSWRSTAAAVGMGEEEDVGDGRGEKGV
jgi:hypothetical protein